MFTDSFELKTHKGCQWTDLWGQLVRYAGIEIGAVESVVFK